MPGSNSRPNVSEGYEVPLSYRGDRLEDGDARAQLFEETRFDEGGRPGYIHRDHDQEPRPHRARGRVQHGLRAVNGEGGSHSHR